MPFSADSAIAAKVVESPSSEVGPRNGSIDAICIHMAEGGGTVPWLTRPDGNSSHYVVEYTGRVVQMVRESYWAGSINPRLVRKDDDAPYTYLGETIRYGRTAAKRCLGIGADDPNRHVIAIETEGFAKDGPNAAQRDALRRLVADIRRRRGPLPCLGHRDFQNYKPCPGKRIPWADYGGHAVATGEDDLKQPIITNTSPMLIDIAIGAELYAVDAETPAGITNHIARLGVVSPYGSYDKRAFALDPDGAGSDLKRSIYFVVPAKTYPIPTPTAEPEPVAYDVTVEVGGQTVTGTVTLP